MATTLVKHPFSLYDFMGYFIPGLYTTWVLFTLDYFTFCTADNDTCNQEKGLINLIKLNSFSQYLDEINHIIILSSIYIIFAYIMGQLISIACNITLEELPYIDSRRRNFSIILNKREKEKRIGFYILPDNWSNIKLFSWDAFFTAPKIISNILFWLITIQPFLFIFVLLFSPRRTEDDISNNLSWFDNFFRIQGISHLGSDIAIKKITIILLEKFQTAFEDKNCNSYFHYIYHYVYENCDSHILKINNYVALYGFMRNMLMGNIILYYYSLYLLYINKSVSNLYLTLLFGVLNVLFLYGYLKFIRRYTEEIIFAACVIFDYQMIETS